MILEMLKIIIGSIIGALIVYSAIRLIEYDVKRTLKRLGRLR